MHRLHDDSARMVEQDIVGAKRRERRVKGSVDLLIPGDVGVKEGRLATSISDHLNGLAALVILNVKNTDLGTFLGKGQRGGAAHAGSAASDNGYLAGQATIQGFGTCAHDISPETGSDAFAAIDDQRVPGHESGHVRR